MFSQLLTSNYRFSAACLLAAAGLSIYLGVGGLDAGIGGCAASGSCNEVLQSRWSSVLGLPVGFLGAILYLSILVLLPFVQKKGPLRLAHCLLLSLVFLGAVWFVSCKPL